MKTLLELYLTFLKISSVTFGGGYTMLPMLKRDCVEAKNWVTEDELIDFYSASQGLPGIIAINVSILIGNKQKGFWGGVMAALGVISPCLVIITAIAMFLESFQENTIVKNALAGISVCVVALITDAIIGLWKKSIKDIIGIILFVIGFTVTAFTPISPVWLIIAAAVAGILIKSANSKTENKGV